MKATHKIECRGQAAIKRNTRNCFLHSLYHPHTHTSIDHICFSLNIEDQQASHYIYISINLMTIFWLQARDANATDAFYKTLRILQTMLSPASVSPTRPTVALLGASS